jgi:hypothetical protein
MLFLLSIVANRVAVGEMPGVRVADDKRGFVLSDSRSGLPRPKTLTRPGDDFNTAPGDPVNHLCEKSA